MAQSFGFSIGGNFRFLSVERLEGDNDSCTFNTSGGDPSLSQCDPEIELDNEDVGVTMSGIIGQVGYIYYFK